MHPRLRSLRTPKRRSASGLYRRGSTCALITESTGYSEKTSAVAEISHLTAEIQHSEKEVKRLAQSGQKLLREMEDLEAEVGHLRHDVRAAIRSKSSLDDNLQTMQEIHRASVAAGREMLDELHGLSQTASQLRAERARILSSNAQLREERDSLRQRAEMAQAAVAAGDSFSPVGRLTPIGPESPSTASGCSRPLWEGVVEGTNAGNSPPAFLARFKFGSGSVSPSVSRRASSPQTSAMRRPVLQRPPSPFGVSNPSPMGRSGGRSPPHGAAGVRPPSPFARSRSVPRLHLNTLRKIGRSELDAAESKVSKVYQEREKMELALSLQIKKLRKENEALAERIADRQRSAKALREILPARVMPALADIKSGLRLLRNDCQTGIGSLLQMVKRALLDITELAGRRRRRRAQEERRLVRRNSLRERMHRRRLSVMVSPAAAVSTAPFGNTSSSGGVTSPEARLVGVLCRVLRDLGLPELYMTNPVCWKPKKEGVLLVRVGSLQRWETLLVSVDLYDRHLRAMRKRDGASQSVVLECSVDGMEAKLEGDGIREGDHAEYDSDECEGSSDHPVESPVPRRHDVLSHQVRQRQHLVLQFPLTGGPIIRMTGAKIGEWFAWLTQLNPLYASEGKGEHV